MKHKRLVFRLVSLIAVAFSFHSYSAPPESTAARLLKEMDACFELVDLKTGHIVERYGGKRCEDRFPPCSTFKVPLAVMGFESGVLKDEHTSFKWDGKPKMIKSWERDQDARSWIKESVVWYSQEVARRLGADKMAKYMREWDYGNADMTGGLETAWLSPEPDPKSAVKSSIAISADEQIKFFSNLWLGKLPHTSPRSMELARELSYWETSANGYTLHGKTGSGYAGKGTKRRLGWFVGRVAKGAKEYIGVVSFTDKEEPDAKAGYAGPQSRDLFKEIVRGMGYW